MCHIPSQLETMTHLPTLFTIRQLPNHIHTHIHHAPYITLESAVFIQFTKTTHDKNDNIAQSASNNNLHLRMEKSSTPFPLCTHIKYGWMFASLTLSLSIFNMTMFYTRMTWVYGIRLIEWRISCAQLVIQYCNDEIIADSICRFKWGRVMSLASRITQIFTYFDFLCPCPWIEEKWHGQRRNKFVYGVFGWEGIGIECRYTSPVHNHLYPPRQCSRIRSVQRFRVPHRCQCFDGIAPEMSW